MTQNPIFQRDQGLLSHIERGMVVYDRHGHQIGTVDTVHFGVDSHHGVAAAAPSSPGGRNETLVDAFWNAFRVDRVPEVLHERLMQHGFVRIDSDALLMPDRYVMAEQIARVDDSGVHLQVDREALVKG